MSRILVTGAGGQLGNCFKKLEENYPQYNFVFKTSKELDITDEGAVLDIFNEEKPSVCINAAAYTAVDLAEQEQEKAYDINANGVENLAKACQENQTLLIHISTDYVFDGDTNLPYSEDDFTNPLGVYGKSKLRGEELALENNPNTIVIRTSWLYSEFNKNFVKTMLHLFSQKDELNIVNDQFGQPTNANDLAEAVMKIIETPSKKMGIYHFSNYSEATWYEFATKIKEFSKSNIKLNPIPTEAYPTPAKRPHRSTFALDKIEKDYQIEIKYWQPSLESCIEILKENEENYFSS
ncbi:dTDP-4-dehydrorhamnose reductase [Riemerella anatipestifer]|uniref:dTDP-4-dehydrorhamnose reductase n=1 Tax=Riemerella anatipestifer TaxID=34085 RepID=UPI0012ADA85D|nr:dTDP-4-dehydrorhamnose reductase [Riemerella anatipestifer]MCO7319132.1 dTDP-4-dehydrorhamnose reductase [Riemerella anatipestifer]MCQ4155334.1 dTDP-4-dehydrorhamnose reductase [Riemerella anatipestifer]MCQ4181296.1 dTDP-4-dehydrorhamnose reductase [Riemerella anatipestifer]MCW0474615.1 dTDP-4-dehydrorhamnose reductase [Riemerella anatipestifer]MDR7775383.1 dTDP-4-dehydrorhamnose reductase [Riemerella anatipestifer]